jgi:hypothetical protein
MWIDYVMVQVSITLIATGFSAQDEPDARSLKVSHSML